MYFIQNGSSYIGLNDDNTQTIVHDIDKALSFFEKQKALNYKDNLKSTLKRFNWQIVEVDYKDITLNDTKTSGSLEYNETSLEKMGFDIVDFFRTAITTISQLKNYALNMGFLEEEYNKKILDVRHYIRDDRVRLNAIQMQRIGYFLQQLEKERYECKSNHMIAEIFLSDLNRLENISYIDEIKNIKESQYNPRVLTYEMLDEISGRRNKK